MSRKIKIMIYRQGASFTARYKREDSKEEVLRTGGEEVAFFEEGSIKRCFWNLQVNTSADDIKLLVASDKELNIDDIVPNITYGTAWNLKELSETVKNFGICAGDWILNGMPLQHALFPRQREYKTVYLYTYPVIHPSVPVTFQNSYIDFVRAHSSQNAGLSAPVAAMDRGESSLSYIDFVHTTQQKKPEEQAKSAGGMKPKNDTMIDYYHKISQSELNKE